jgi:ABC-type branched-subunit amino acid transport system ATPase component
MIPPCARPILAMPMLEVAALKAGYGGGTVLDGVSLQIADGEIVALLGRNGMGKTTLLRAIMGLLKPSAGTVTFNGASLAGRDTFEIARAGIAYVPQGREIFAGLSVAENLSLGGSNPAEAFGFFPALAAKAGEPGTSLSGGQQQQLAIARALLMHPKLLLLDEPSEGIQPSIVREIADAVTKAARARGLSVLLVEQNTGLALASADRAMFMSAGVISGDYAAKLVTRDVLARHMGL